MVMVVVKTCRKGPDSAAHVRPIKETIFRQLSLDRTRSVRKLSANLGVEWRPTAKTGCRMKPASEEWFSCARW